MADEIHENIAMETSRKLGQGAALLAGCVEMEKRKVAMKSNHSQVLRDYHNELCRVFNCAVDEVLLDFAGKLYSKRIIDMETKIAVSRRKGYEAADILMDRVEIKIDQSPTSLVIVLQVMAKVEILKHILEKIQKKREATKLEAEDMETESSVFLWFIIILLWPH